jgi:hypothetical protein
MILPVVVIILSIFQFVFLSGTPTANRAGKKLAFFTFLLSLVVLIVLIPQIYFDVLVQPDERMMPGVYRFLFSQLPLFNFFMFQVFKKRIRKENYVG